jgi:glyceraldehyde-3-phosphate dehydrogenase (NAD(P))
VTERPKLEALIAAGAELVAPIGSQAAFADQGIRVRRSAEEALREATVILDCSPAANSSKAAYEGLDARLIVAQGSETGFGKPYAWGVNDEAIDPHDDRFVQVVSCNTHAITTILTALSGDPTEIDDGRFVLLRRGNDVGQDKGLVGAPVPTRPTDPRFGTHHARDAHRVLATLGADVSLHSSALKVSTQLMHAMWFDVTLRDALSLEYALMRLAEEPRLALTHKTSANAVFSFGRDHGPHGRLLNHAVVVADTVAVRGERQVSGFAFTPQDGNTLLSNLVLVARALDPVGWRDRVACVQPHLFSEV